MRFILINDSGYSMNSMTAAEKKAMKTLNEFVPGESGKIESIEMIDSKAQRLMAMGIMPGEKITLMQIAPLGDPITISIAGRKFSLRKSDARLIHLL